MINIEPHRPYLILRHFSGAVFRYTSWRDLRISRDYENLRWGHLNYGHHGSFLAHQHQWVYREGEAYFVRGRYTTIYPFSLRWDDGTPVSEEDKLYDEQAAEKHKAKREKARRFKAKKRKRALRGRGHPKYKRHLRYWDGSVSEEGEPPVRTKAGGAVPIFDYEYQDFRHIDRSWKSQSKRRHQWRPM